MIVDSPIAAGRRFCGLSEKVLEEARRRQLAWKKTHLKWFIADRIPGLPLADFTAVLTEGFAAWARVCGLSFEQVFTQSLADIVVLTRNIDGDSGTLAEAELPPGDERRLRMWIDLGEEWHAKADLSPPTNKQLIDLLAVITHEIGHLLGISHEPTKNVTALMDPYYTPNIRKPMAWDIQQARFRYGDAKPAAPDDDPLPIPGSAYPLTIHVTDANGVQFKPVLAYPEQS